MLIDIGVGNVPRHESMHQKKQWGKRAAASLANIHVTNAGF